MPAVWIVSDHQFAMNAFESLFWTGCAFVLLRMIQNGDTRLWIAFGAIGGLGLENKYSMGFFAAALLLGLLISSQRKLLWTPWLLAGGGVALLIFLPNLLWNIHHHWPFLELMRNIRTSGKDIALPPSAYLGQQALMMAPLTLPFWLAGLGFYFFSRRAAAYRMFGWAFVFTIAFFMLMHGKDYYSAPAYGMVLAAGAVATEIFFDSERFATYPKLRWFLRGATIRSLVIMYRWSSCRWFCRSFPIEKFIAYQKWLGIEPSRTEKNQIGVLLPQYYADELGWQEMVEQVARVYHSLPPDQQRRPRFTRRIMARLRRSIFLAGAMDCRRRSARTRIIFLGPREYTGEIMILVGSDDIEEAREHFASVEIAATLNNPYSMPHEKHPFCWLAD